MVPLYEMPIMMYEMNVNRILCQDLAQRECTK